MTGDKLQAEYRADRIVTQLLDLVEDLEALIRDDANTIQAMHGNRTHEADEVRAHHAGRMNAFNAAIRRLQAIADGGPT